MNVKNLKGITATFVGKDGSMGFISGHRYQLRIGSRNGVIVIKCTNGVEVPYESIQSFLNNWDDIKNIQP